MAGSGNDYFYVNTLRSIRSNDCCSNISYTSSYPLGVMSGSLYYTNLDLYKLDCCGGRDLIESKTNVSANTSGPVIFETDICDGSYELVVWYDEWKRNYTIYYINNMFNLLY